MREQCLEFLQQVEAELVVRTGARFLVQARRGFQVVVHHIGRRGLQDVQRAVVAAPEIGHQHLDLGAGRQLAHLADALRKVAGATVAQVVAVHAGDDHVFQLQLGNRLGQVDRLVRIQRVWPAMAHVAKRATAGALVAHDHEGGRAFAEALADVGATGFFADRHQLVGPQHILDLVKTRGGRAGLDADPLRLLQHLGRHDLDRDARGLGLAFLFGGGVVLRHRLRLAHGVRFGGGGRGVGAVHGVHARGVRVRSRLKE